MKHSSVFLTSALSSFAVAACGHVIRLVVKEPVKLNPMSLAYENWMSIANAMDERYGLQLYNDKIDEVVVAVQTCILSACSGTSEYYYSKPCDKTLGATARKIGIEMFDGGGKPPGHGKSGGDNCGNSGIGGGLEQGVIGYKPIYRTATVSIPGGGSTSQNVLVGYEPIYGTLEKQAATYC